MTQPLNNDLASQLLALKQQESKNREAEIRLNAEKESIQRDLEVAKKKAEDEFGTSDIVKMRELYVKYSNEDKAAIAKFSEAVNQRKALLEDIQERLTAHRTSLKA